jgi:4-hydroxy-tetrahydrodipicolinate synthase
MLGELLTAIVTPFRADGSVDFDAFRALANHLVEHGSDGIVVAGTTGESPTLSDDEKVALFEAAVDELRGRATVVAGTGTYDTAHSVHLTERAHAAGVDGFLVVTPYYNKPPQRGIVANFRAIAEVSDRPVVVYNIPGRVVVNIEPETIVQLAQIPSVRAVKQANDDLEQARRIVAETDLDLYAGDDNLVLPFLRLGGVGGICVRSHIAGERMKEMIRLHHAGDAEGAQRIHEELIPVFDLDRVAVNPIPIKTALALLGHEVGGFRLPLVDATDAERDAIRQAVERVGLRAPTPA